MYHLPEDIDFMAWSIFGTKRFKSVKMIFWVGSALGYIFFYGYIAKIVGNPLFG